MRIHIQIAHKGKRPRKCIRCGHEIASGEKYFWIKHRHMAKQYFCSTHYPKSSDLTTSDKLATLYSTEENLRDVVGTLEGTDVSISEWMGTEAPEEPEILDDDDGDSQREHDKWEEEMKEWEAKKEEYESACSDLESALEDAGSQMESAAEDVRQVGEDYETSASNMEEYFPGSYQIDEIREKSDSAISWADTIESAGQEISGLTTEISNDDPVNGRKLDDILEEAVGTFTSALDEFSF